MPQPKCCIPLKDKPQAVRCGIFSIVFILVNCTSCNSTPVKVQSELSYWSQQTPGGCSADRHETLSSLPNKNYCLICVAWTHIALFGSSEACKCGCRCLRAPAHMHAAACMYARPCMHNVVFWVLTYACMNAFAYGIAYETADGGSTVGHEFPTSSQLSNVCTCNASHIQACTCPFPPAGL